MEGAGVVIHDAQYTPEEYPSKKNWGHSTYEYAVELAAAASVRELVLTHHDPTHDDTFVEMVEKRAREHAKKLGDVVDVCCAYEGLNLTVAPHGVQHLTGSPAAPRASPDLVRGRLVLVVDDDPDIRALAHLALSQDGHTVIEAASGQEALALVDGQTPDLIVLDLLMPGQGGLEVLEILRSKPATAALPVVVLTAMDDEANIRAGFELGATDYVTKPFSIPQLAARVRACLKRRGSGVT
jgi:CheY-like chemotaxis protein